MRSNKRNLTLMALLLLVATVALAFTKEINDWPNPQIPPPNKEVYVMVQYATDSDPIMTAKLERAIGEEIVASHLRQHGFDVQRVMSFTELAYKNGGPSRILINELEDEPMRENARIVWVTIVAFPGSEEGTVRTGLAVLDVYAYGIPKARRESTPANVRFLWVHEGPENELTLRQAPAELRRGLWEALAQYAKQHAGAIRIGNYQDIFPAPARGVGAPGYCPSCD